MVRTRVQPFPACARPWNGLSSWPGASAGEDRSDKTVRKQWARRDDDRSSRFSAQTHCRFGHRRSECRHHTIDLVHGAISPRHMMHALPDLPQITDAEQRHGVPP